MKVRSFGARVALLSSAALTVFATPALAQAAAENEPNLDEIVVTANKREENLQKAPLAISAIPAAQLELRGLSEAKDLSAIAPNVSIVGATTNATAAVVSIRGIPSAADETQGFDSPIGMYLDGVFLARASAASFEVADIERVEVLRGPQGTLFGRNTTGGAINFITKKPSHDANLKLRAGVGNFNAWNVRAVANTGDLGPVQISLGYNHRERHGIVDNLLQPSDSQDPGAQKLDSFRVAANWDVTDNFSIYNVFDWTKITAVPNASQLAAVGNGVVRPNITLDGNTFAPVQPANIGGFLNQAGVSVSAGCSKTPTRAYQSSLCHGSYGPSTDKIWGNLLRMELSLPTITVRSSTAYRQWDNTIFSNQLDGLGNVTAPLFSTSTLFNGMPAGLISFVLPASQAAFAPFIAATPVPSVTGALFQADNNRGQHQFSQELEFVSSAEGPFQWVVGAYYFSEKGHELNHQKIGFVLDTNAAVFTTASFGALAPGFQAANPARYRVVPTLADLAYTAWGNSFALYGQASYRPGGEDGPLGVTLGLRQTWDSKGVDRTQNGAAPFSAAEYALNKRKATFAAPTGHLTVDYRANDNINLYARVAKGYRSGGFNLRQSTSVANNIGLLPFNEEKLWSYEVGAKTEFLNRIRLNVSLYHNVYSDQLATIPIPISGGGSFGTQVVNAGKTVYNGVEVEGMFKLNDMLSIDGNFGYSDIKIKEFPGADITGVTRNIAALYRAGSYSPKYSANVAANLTIPVNDMTKVVGRVGYNYTSEFQMFPNQLTAPFSDATKGDARGLLDAQFKIQGLGMEGVSLTIWGKNLTNKHYVVRAVDFGQLGMGTVIYGDPRTFGATLDLTF